MTTTTKDVELVFTQPDTGNIPVTTSNIIAEKFGKLHKNILRDIQNLECSEAFIELNFEPIETPVKVGFGTRYDLSYLITKDGFMLLVMGFTGKKAMDFKVKFINAFNAAEKRIRELTWVTSSKSTFDLPRTYLDALKALVKAEEENVELMEVLMEITGDLPNGYIARLNYLDDLKALVNCVSWMEFSDDAYPWLAQCRRYLSPST